MWHAIWMYFYVLNLTILLPKIQKFPGFIFLSFFSTLKLYTIRSWTLYSIILHVFKTYINGSNMFFPLAQTKDCCFFSLVHSSDLNNVCVWLAVSKTCNCIMSSVSIFLFCGLIFTAFDKTSPQSVIQEYRYS